MSLEFFDVESLTLVFHEFSLISLSFHLIFKRGITLEALKKVQPIDFYSNILPNFLKEKSKEEYNKYAPKLSLRFV